MKPASARSAGLAGLTAALLALSGCASGPSPVWQLQMARQDLEVARRTPTPAVQAQVKDAEIAIEYAEFEYQNAPSHPLSQMRAQNALEKARSARRLAESSAPRPPVSPALVATSPAVVPAGVAPGTAMSIR